MRLRSTFPLFVGLALAGCAGDTAEEAAEATEMASAETEMAADAGAALADLAEQYETHYNMHHASMVADFYTEDGVALLADGGVYDGRDAILANLETVMENEPTLSLEPVDNVVAGDMAVARGTWSVETNMDGQAVSMSGDYMTLHTRVDGEWKIQTVVTNYDAPPPAEMERGPTPEEAPADEGTLTELTDYFATHYNMGHAGMVASKYTEDAFASYAHAPAAEGRAAIEAELARRIEAGGTDLVIHDVATVPLGDGMAADIGWYEVQTPDGPLAGAYMTLAEQADDGSWLIRWHVSNGMPAPEGM